MGIKIDKDKCVGCGLCANICSEGIEIVDGVAVVKDGNADCLKEAAESCSRNAILLNGESGGTNGEGEGVFGQDFSQGRGMGGDQSFGMGRGQGRGRGMGRGQSQGRGMGRGGGRR